MEDGTEIIKTDIRKLFSSGINPNKLINELSKKHTKPRRRISANDIKNLIEQVITEDDIYDKNIIECFKNSDCSDDEKIASCSNFICKNTDISCGEGKPPCPEDTFCYKNKCIEGSNYKMAVMNILLNDVPNLLSLGLPVLERQVDNTLIYNKNTDVMRDKFMLIKGHMQSGKTSFMIGSAIKYYLYGLSSIIVLRNSTADLVQITKRIKSMINSINTTIQPSEIHINILTSEHKYFEREVKNVSNTPKIIILLSNTNKLRVISRALNLYYKNFILMVDESDEFLGRPTISYENLARMMVWDNNEQKDTIVNKIRGLIDNIYRLQNTGENPEELRRYEAELTRLRTPPSDERRLPGERRPRNHEQQYINLVESELIDTSRLLNSFSESAWCTFVVSATILDNIFNSTTNTSDIIVLNPPSNYMGVNRLQYTIIPTPALRRGERNVRISVFDDNRNPALLSYLENFNNQKYKFLYPPDNFIPNISLIRVSIKKDDMEEIFEQIRRKFSNIIPIVWTEDYIKIYFNIKDDSVNIIDAEPSTFVENREIGEIGEHCIHIRTFKNNLRVNLDRFIYKLHASDRQPMIIESELELENNEGNFQFDNKLGISTILTFLQKFLNKDLQRNIIIITGKNAGRGISFSSELTPNWHLTEMYYMPGNESHPDILQTAGRLCGNYSDNTIPTMICTRETRNDILEAYSIQENIINNAKRMSKSRIIRNILTNDDVPDVQIKSMIRLRDRIEGEGRNIVKHDYNLADFTPDRNRRNIIRRYDNPHDDDTIINYIRDLNIFQLSEYIFSKKLENQWFSFDEFTPVSLKKLRLNQVPDITTYPYVNGVFVILTKEIDGVRYFKLQTYIN